MAVFNGELRGGRRIYRVAGLASVVLFYGVVAAMYLRPSHYDPTMFICNGARWGIQEIAPLKLWAASEVGYDGQFYYAMGLRPFDLDAIRKHVDLPGYRYQRILIPLLGHLLSFGEPKAVHVAMLLASFALVLAATWVFMEWFHWRHAGWGWALLFPLFPGTVHSLLRLTPDAPAAALALIGCYLWAREKTRSAAVALSLALLARETMILIPVGLAIHAAWRRDFRRLAPLAIPVAACAIWLLVVRHLFGGFPFRQAGGNLVSPMSGIVDGYFRNRHMIAERRSVFIKIGVFNLMVVAQFLLIASLAIGDSVRGAAGPFGPVLVLLVVLTLCLSGETWEYEWSITRVVLPVALFYLIHALENGLRPRDKIVNALTIPTVWFMLNWMNLRF